MNPVETSRPPLRIRHVNLDTGRENVVVISRQSKALRAEIFRGFSRVELRCDSKVLLATLLITDDDALVGPHEIGLSEPAFRRFAEPAGRLVTVTPAVPPESLEAVRAKIRGQTLSTAEITAIVTDLTPLPLFRHGDRRVPDRLREFHDQRRVDRPHPGDGQCGNAAEMGQSGRG
jgi:thymidine phosphorylase